MQALRQAIEHMGGVTQLAEALDCGQSVVSNWLLRGAVPAARCADIQRVTNNVVQCHELRPDVFPAPNTTEVA